MVPSERRGTNSLPSCAAARIAELAPTKNQTEIAREAGFDVHMTKPVDLRKLSADARASHGIGYVPQGREIFSQLSVEENLRMGLIAKRERPADALERVYTQFPVLKQMLRRRGGDLSGGQQQQLAIGRALLLQPRLLILDEPCEGIQPNIVHEIGDIILKLNEVAGLTVLLVRWPVARGRAGARAWWVRFPATR